MIQTGVLFQKLEALEAELEAVIELALSDRLLLEIELLIPLQVKRGKDHCK